MLAARCPAAAIGATCGHILAALAEAFLVECGKHSTYKMQHRQTPQFIPDVHKRACATCSADGAYTA